MEVDDSGYDISDPKHPGYFDNMLDYVYGRRERERLLVATDTGMRPMPRYLTNCDPGDETDFPA